MNKRETLLADLFELVFEQKFNVFGLSAINYFLTEPKNTNTTSINIFKDSEKDVCVLAKKLKKILRFSFDITMHYKRYEEYDECSYDSEEEEEDEIIRQVTMSLKYKYKKNIDFTINIHHGPFYNLNFTFDFEGICMTDKNTLTINKAVSHSYSLIDAMKSITNKKFRILPSFCVCEHNRKEMGIKQSTKRLLRYIDASKEVVDVLNQGFTLQEDQKLEEIFDPCLIAETAQQPCSICHNNMQKYELKLYCCKQFMCFNCSYDYIKSRSDNSEIFCPFCKGDPFGCHTN